MGKFLFIRGGAVGDFILTMPAIQLVRDQLPDNEIEVLGYPAVTELALVTGLVDRTRSIEDARLAAFFAPGAELNQDWCDYFASFDVVLSYLYDPDGFFAGNLERAGVKTLLNCPFRPAETDPPVSAAIQLAKPLERFALFLEEPALALNYADSVSSPLPPGEGKTRIAIHPGSGSPSKNWSFESWIEVLSHLHGELESVEFIVTSGEAEYEVIADFLALLDQRNLPYHHLAGKTLPELGVVYSEVDLYLGHDSGISHLAGSAGARGFLLFGPTNPEIWAPPGGALQPILSPDGSLGGIQVDQVMEMIRFESSSHTNRRVDISRQN
ncbi:MAG: glycosyltransferase family 9 protein [Verrucomicrobiales bacterium]|nr:glycosyltransferase family 9 protein [Verrucomicrobiales bacterium]